MTNFKFDKELFENAVNNEVADRNFLLMDDLSIIKMCVENALEICLDTSNDLSEVCI